MRGRSTPELVMGFDPRCGPRGCRGNPGDDGALHVPPPQPRREGRGGSGGRSRAHLGLLALQKEGGESMRRVCVALLVALAACGDNGSEPDDPVFDGTWTGVYTNNASTVAFQAELQLNQNGDQITGGLATSSGRSATVSGTVSGDQLEATFTYTDGCAGTATVTADLVDERVPPELTGNYVSTDCVGETTGTFALTKQE